MIMFSIPRCCPLIFYKIQRKSSKTRMPLSTSHTRLLLQCHSKKRLTNKLTWNRHRCQWRLTKRCSSNTINIFWTKAEIHILTQALSTATWTLKKLSHRSNLISSKSVSTTLQLSLRFHPSTVISKVSKSKTSSCWSKKEWALLKPGMGVNQCPQR